MAWLTVLIAALMTFGALISIFVWLVPFLRFRSKEGWSRSVLYSLAAVIAVSVFVAILHLFVPMRWMSRAALGFQWSTFDSDVPTVTTPMMYRSSWEGK
jgi:hypothetical protein